MNLSNLREYFKIAVKTIATRRVRSWLTTIGVVIGVFLIVSLLSLSQGLKNAVLQQLSMVGKDLLIVMPGDITDLNTLIAAVKLTDEDIKIIEGTEGVDKVVPMDYTSVTMRYGDSKKPILLYGVDLRNGLDVLKSDVGWSIADCRLPFSPKK